MSIDADKMNAQAVSRDPAINEMVEAAQVAEIPTVWDRHRSQQPHCKFGTSGVCCRLCHMGPCRIISKAPVGICGANADTIVARNLLREIAAGTAAHSDHGRMLVKTLKLVSKGESGDYSIKEIGRAHV
jgi:carbon-monoxide dehydrogenase catalytic subunit